jgi:putative YhdH/YhfP family quinone oxidoreductase
MTAFKALWTVENNGKFQTSVITRDTADLPDGDLLIRVTYSSLNYKDALSASGNKGVTSNFPHTPGIDAVGIVEQSRSADFKSGDSVIVTGFDLGMNTCGGLAEYIQVPAHWAVSKPENLSPCEAMIYGTAGLTAALCLEKLLAMGALPGKDQSVLVTGASGGVGCIAISLLKKLGFSVLASSGKKDKTDFLESLGADSVIDRSLLSEANNKPLLKPQWHHAIDTVGGATLVNVLKSIHYGGSVACCGLAQSSSLDATVFPFILRGVNLLGVDSVECPTASKQAVWEKLANQWKPDQLHTIYQEHDLADVPDLLPGFLKGQISGRVVIRL